MDTGVSPGRTILSPSFSILPSGAIFVISVTFLRYPFSVSQTPRETVPFLLKVFSRRYAVMAYSPFFAAAKCFLISKKALCP